VIKPEVKAEEDQNTEGHQRRKAAIGIHYVIDPIAGAHIPDDSTRIREEERLAQRLSPPEDREQQRHKRYPAKEVK
jgi:hypothetical protein